MLMDKEAESMTDVKIGRIEAAELEQGLRTTCEMESPDPVVHSHSACIDGFEMFEMLGSLGSKLNVVEGLQLWTNVLTQSEQAQLVERINYWEQDGLKGLLKGRTFAAPKRWIRGKGRRTIQFGCCYNYSKDKYGNRAGILVDEMVEDMPPVLNSLSQRLVRWGVIPEEFCPDSAIVNIYSEGDCIPPHIDNMQFLRPFVTISLLSEEVIKFGLNLTPEKPGEFTGGFKLSLPLGSCLVMNGNAANIAKHCVPAVYRRRISITLRKMDPYFAGLVKRAHNRCPH